MPSYWPVRQLQQKDVSTVVDVRKCWRVEFRVKNVKWPLGQALHVMFYNYRPTQCQFNRPKLYKLRYLDYLVFSATLYMCYIYAFPHVNQCCSLLMTLISWIVKNVSIVSKENGCNICFNKQIALCEPRVGRTSSRLVSLCFISVLNVIAWHATLRVHGLNFTFIFLPNPNTEPN